MTTGWLVLAIAFVQVTLAALAARQVVADALDEHLRLAGSLDRP